MDNLSAPGNAQSTTTSYGNVSVRASHDFSDDEDGDAHFSDGGSLPRIANNVEFVPIRAHVTEDVDEDYEGDIEEEASYASPGSYDSPPEPLGTVPIRDSSLNPWSGDNFQKLALRQLNELNTGFASLDTSILESTDQEGFTNQVLNIAKANSLSQDDFVIQNILIALLPLVGKKFKNERASGEDEMRARVDLTRLMPVAKPTVEDDDQTDGIDDEGLGGSEIDEDDTLGSARGFRVRASDEEDLDLSSHVPSHIVRRAESLSEHEEELIDSSNSGISGTANVEPDPQDNFLQESDESASKLEETAPVLLKNSSEEKHDHSGHMDGSCIEIYNETSPGKHEDDFEGECTVSAGENRNDLQEAISQDLHTEERQSAGAEEHQPIMKYSTIPSLIDSVNADAPSEAQPLDLSSSSAIEPCSNFNVQLTDASQNLADMYMSGTDGKESATSPLLMNEAEEKRNLEEEPRDLVHISMANLRELEVENHGYTNKSDMSTDGSLPVADSVSSKPVAEPTSDMTSFGGAGPALAVQPVGLGSSMSLEHAPRAVQRSSGRSVSLYSMGREDSDPLNDTSEGNQETHEKLKGIRIKFLRLVHRLGQPPHNTVVAQVLYRLGLAEQLRGGQGNRHSRSFGLDRASMEAEEQEAMGHDDLEFECTLLLLGKSGVGKSATINSLFDEVKVDTDAFNPATKSVNVVTGTVYGIKLRIIDTPGLSNSFVDQRHNRRVLATVKRMIKKTSPDIVLYFERMDVQLRDFSDLPLLQAITDTFGAAVWFNALIVFTHAACAPPDGTNGSPVNYDLFVSHQSHVLQQSIRQVAGDIRLMNPVSLVENHIACRTNRSGQKVLPNGHVWKSQLLLLCFSSKILAQANALLKLQDSVSANSLGIRSRVPPLPYLLSSLLQSRAQLRLPDEQGVEDGDSDVELEDDESDSDGEEDYDDLPPFRRLTREELKLLDKEQQRLYFEELEDRERLFMKKLIKEEKERRKQRKRMSMLSNESGKPVGNQNEEENADATVPVAMPDMVLPPSFDSDNPTYRYRYLDTPSQWLVRPVLETHGWDHDNGYDGVNAERTFVLFEKIPASVSGQASKDKKEANIQMECAASFKSGFDKSTLAGLEIQSIGRDLAYTVRSETRFSNFKRNKTTCGLAVTKLGDTVVAGMKIEDRLMISKRLKVLVNGGALTGRGDTAYGGSLEASVRGKDYYVNHSSSSLGLSIMNWHGDLAVGGNLQIQVQMGKILYTCRANLNNKGAGQINIRANSSDQVNMVLIGLIPFIRTFINNVILNANETSS